MGRLISDSEFWHSTTLSHGKQMCVMIFPEGEYITLLCNVNMAWARKNIMFTSWNLAETLLNDIQENIKLNQWWNRYISCMKRTGIWFNNILVIILTSCLVKYAEKLNWNQWEKTLLLRCLSLAGCIHKMIPLKWCVTWAYMLHHTNPVIMAIHGLFFKK